MIKTCKGKTRNNLITFAPRGVALEVVLIPEQGLFLHLDPHEHTLHKHMVFVC